MDDQGPQEQYYRVEKVTGRGYERSWLSEPSTRGCSKYGQKKEEAAIQGLWHRALGVGDPPFTLPFEAVLRCHFPGRQEISRVQYHHSLRLTGVEPPGSP